MELIIDLVSESAEGSVAGTVRSCLSALDDIGEVEYLGDETELRVEIECPIEAEAGVEAALDEYLEGHDSVEAYHYE